MKKRLEISTIHKMIDKISQIKDLYSDLSEETQNIFNDNFNYENKPPFLINSLEIVFDDMLDIRKS